MACKLFLLMFSMRVNGSSSDSLHVSSRVPPGSVLGPLLIIISIDDIADLQLSNGSMTSYADDIVLYCLFIHLLTITFYSRMLMKYAPGPCTNNLLKFNSTKCRKRSPSQPNTPLTVDNFQWNKFDHTGTLVFGLPLL